MKSESLAPGCGLSPKISEIFPATKASKAKPKFAQPASVKSAATVLKRAVKCPKKDARDGEQEWTATDRTKTTAPWKESYEDT